MGDFKMLCLALTMESSGQQGRIQDFKLGGRAHFKKLRRAEGGAKNVGVFHVKSYFFQF
jgi:hypothetical protein